MNILETLVQLRDDLKTWVTKNLNALNAKIDEKTIPIDSELSATSTNPVQNKVINAEINSLSNLIGDKSVATQISKAIANQDLFSGDYNDLVNAPNILDDGSSDLKISDENGNIIVQIDEAGVKSIDFYVGDTSLKEKIHMWDSKSGFSGDYYDLYNKPSIAEHKLDEFIIADSEGNIIGKFDKNGLQTTTIFSENIFLQNNNLLHQVIDLYKRMDSMNYDDIKNAPPITSVQEQKLRVVDEQGNIVCLIDADGVTTTKINTDELILSNTNMDAEFADFNLRLENFDKRIDNFQTKITNFENSITLTKVTYSTTDLVSGTSVLSTGELYIVYE